MSAYDEWTDEAVDKRIESILSRGARDIDEYEELLLLRHEQMLRNGRKDRARPA